LLSAALHKQRQDDTANGQREAACVRHNAALELALRWRSVRSSGDACNCSLPDLQVGEAPASFQHRPPQPRAQLSVLEMYACVGVHRSRRHEGCAGWALQSACDLGEKWSERRLRQTHAPQRVSYGRSAAREREWRQSRYGGGMLIAVALVATWDRAGLPWLTVSEAIDRCRQPPLHPRVARCSCKQRLHVRQRSRKGLGSLATQVRLTSCCLTGGHLEIRHQEKLLSCAGAA